MENGGKRMIEEDGIVWYSCTSTCRRVQVVSELGMESSPTRSIPTVSMSTYVGAGARGSFEIGVRYKVNKHNILPTASLLLSAYIYLERSILK